MPKLSNKWVALCTAAVGVAYAAGYVVTEPTQAKATATLAPDTPSVTQNNNQNNANNSNTYPSNQRTPGAFDQGSGGQYGHHHRRDGDGGFNAPNGPSSFNGNNNGSSFSAPSSGNSSSNNSSFSSSSSSSKSTAGSTSTIYKDGTYQGSGMNRYGVVSVSVTIKSHKITAVQITACNTHYPEQAIVNLPQQVIASQSANVHLVSGATGSSEDFQQAVAQALQSAQS